MAKGLYFYKLVSPYSEDVTKDCKLTVNEIDSNFINLKNADISNIHVDEENKKLILTRNDGEELVFDLSPVIPSLEIDYNSVDGVISIEHDGQKYLIKDLITKDNLSKEILTKVYSDSTLQGIGTSKTPLKLASVEKTGSFRPVLRIIDTTINDRLPMHHVAKGDRYVVLEEVSDYGLLYNFDGVKHLNELLSKTRWRVPTKDDWDNMLNAIEPCEYRNHNSTINNQVLGKYAGALLKSTEEWRSPSHDCMIEDDKHPHHHHHCEYSDETFDIDFVEHEHGCGCRHPHEKPMDFKGFDAFGLAMLPAGYAYYACPMQYQHFGFQGAYWTSETIYDSDVYTKVFDAKDSGVMQIGERPSAFLSIRLVKDYDGTNHKGIENILGQNYRTVLMPSLNNPNGYAIWTAQNLNIKERHLETTAPNAGLGIEKRRVYFIHEWNGFDWDKIEMSEGDSVVVLNEDNHNETYRIIGGKLVSVTQHILEILRGEINDEMDIIKSRLTKAEEVIDEHTTRLDAIDELIESLSSNTSDSIEKLQEQIDAEVEARTKRDDELQESIDSEVATRAEEDQKLWSELSVETESRQKRDNELQSAIDAEVESRTRRDEELQDSIDAETASRSEEDAKLWEGISTETLSRQKRDEELQSAIDAEVEVRAEEDGKLWAELETETNSRTKRDEELQAEIDSTREKLGEVEQSMWNETTRIEDRLNEEIQRSLDAEDALSQRTSVLEGKALTSECEYDAEKGELKLKAENSDNDITIGFSFNFGELTFEDNN